MGFYLQILVMEDIDKPNLEKQFQLAKKIMTKTGNKVKIYRTTQHKDTIDDSRFIVTSFAVDSLEVMQHDLETVLEYQIYQPVGDIISISGTTRAIRNIPVMLKIVRDIEKLVSEEAWLLNLCNPMAMLCRAVTRAIKVKTIGCCHALYNGAKFLSRCLGFYYEDWKQILVFDVI